MTTSSFKFPSIYEFPPFFTKQVNEQTWKSQLSYWDSLILSYCQHHRQWRVSIHDKNLFENSKIQRVVKPETAKLIFEYMVSKGHAEWQGTKDCILVYVKTPEQWAADIKQWIDGTGQNGSVVTLYELTEGDYASSQEFAGLDPTILKKAVDVLVQQGSAVIMKGTDGQIMGVKML
jgi:ESCRT-II complex subunit VPS25